MLPFFHSFGDFPEVRMWLNSEVRYLSAIGPSFLKGMYGSEESPGADLLLLSFMTALISSIVKEVVVDSYHNASMCC